jgi:hypothetical protein
MRAEMTATGAHMSDSIGCGRIQVRAAHSNRNCQSSQKTASAYSAWRRGRVRRTHPKAQKAQPYLRASVRLQPFFAHRQLRRVRDDVANLDARGDHESRGRACARRGAAAASAKAATAIAAGGALSAAARACDHGLQRCGGDGLDDEALNEL